MSVPFLPFEVLSQIISDAIHSNPGDALALCLSSRACHHAACPLLYETVRLSGSSKAQVFAQSVQRNMALWKHVRVIWGIQLAGSLPPAHASGIIEAGWTDVAPLGGFTIGHAFSTRPAGRWCEDNQTNGRGVWAYHLVTPTLWDWQHKLLASHRSLTQITVTFYPGGHGLVMDDDMLEHVLRRILSNVPRLQHLLLRIAHDRLGAGDRRRRLPRSRALAGAVQRIDDPRIRVEGCHAVLDGGRNSNDVTHYTLDEWDARIADLSGPWPDPPLPLDADCKDWRTNYENPWTKWRDPNGRNSPWDE